jgi:hypothetical protein
VVYGIYTVDKLIVGGTLIIGGEPDVIRLILIGKKYISVHYNIIT